MGFKQQKPQEPPHWRCFLRRPLSRIVVHSSGHGAKAIATRLVQSVTIAPVATIRDVTIRQHLNATATTIGTTTTRATTARIAMKDALSPRARTATMNACRRTGESPATRTSAEVIGSGSAARLTLTGY